VPSTNDRWWKEVVSAATKKVVSAATKEVASAATKAGTAVVKEVPEGQHNGQVAVGLSLGFSCAQSR
jgi:hypothetical protein